MKDFFRLKKVPFQFRDLEGCLLYLVLCFHDYE